jgi:hypothetical protein
MKRITIKRQWIWAAVALVAMVLAHYLFTKLAVLFGGGVVLMSDFSWIGAEDAASKNQSNVNRTNKLNYQMFRQSRGEGGSAVLPLYLRGQDGGLFENELGQDTVNDYAKSRASTPDFQAVSDQYKPTVDAARKTAAGIFNGDVTNERLGNAAPVQKARLAFSRQASIDALHKTLGEIEATNAGRGFTGDTSGDAALKFQANRSAGDAVSAANLQNLGETQSIKDAGLNLELSNLNLPFQMSNAEMAFSAAPHDAYIDSVMKGMQPLSFLRIGGSQPFQYQNGPMVGNTGMWGAASNGANLAGGSALNSWLKQRSANNYQTPSPYSNGSTNTSYGAGGDGFTDPYGNSYGNGWMNQGGAAEGVDIPG